MPSLTLTKSEIAVLRYYRSLKSERFCRSLKTIARACGVTVKTVQRANARFLHLGVLIWVSGNSASWHPGRRKGQANKYLFALTGIEGFDVPPAQARLLRHLTGARSHINPTLPNKHIGHI